MTRGYLRLVCSLLGLAFAALPLYAQDRALDYQNPVAVARHYLEACDTKDVAAAQMALDPAGTEPQALDEAMRGLQNQNFSFDQVVVELLLLPALSHGQHVVGEPVVKGDECRVPVIVTYSVPQTLVLRKGPDGKWHVDLKESIMTSTGLQEPIIFRSPAQAVQTDCLSNLKQICLAFIMYAQDYKGTFPKAEKWTDDLRPYVGADALFRCPAAPGLECGYAMNSRVAGKRLAEIARPAETVLVFDSTKGTRNAADALQSVPKDPPRHQGGNNFGYCDGHCKCAAVDQTPPAWPGQ